MNFRTDLFVLGRVLWLLAEHSLTAGRTFFCSRNACTSFPHHSCPAEHANPIELPPCSDSEVPQYFNTIIGYCRQREPRARLRARKLLEYFPIKDVPPKMAYIVTKYTAINSEISIVNCNECRKRIMDSCYHCNTCHWGDFDLCSNCISQGTHCLVPEHRLVKLIWKDGNFVGVS